MKKGIVFSKKANMWLYYEAHNTHGTQDKMVWCDSKEQAESKLKEENGQPRTN